MVEVPGRFAVDNLGDELGEHGEDIVNPVDFEASVLFPNRPIGRWLNGSMSLGAEGGSNDQMRGLKEGFERGDWVRAILIRRGITIVG